MVLGVNDRVNIIKTSRSCAVCLHPSHTSDKCLSKSKDNYICGIDNCQSHHHPCLHGSTDTFVTAVNVLLRQQYKAVSVGSEDAFLPLGDVHDRVQYQEDSYSLGESMAGMRLVCKTVGVNSGNGNRAREVEEVIAELAKPLIHGDKVLMVMQGIQLVYGMERTLATVLVFF